MNAYTAVANRTLVLLPLRDPLTSLGNLVCGEEFYRGPAEARAGEGKRLRFPARFADDGYSCDLVAVGEHEVEVVPIGTFLPTLKVFEDGKDPRSRTRINRRSRRILSSAEFGSLEDPAESQDINGVPFEFEGYRHGLSS